MAESPWIINVTTEQFEDAILRRSQEVPVVVDFWAPWCQPCRALTPVLEKVINECNGKVILAKVNIDESQDIAAMLGVQSIPLVAVFAGGQPIDSFMGVVPEEQLRKWIERFVPSRAQELLAEAAKLEETDQITCEAKLRESLDLDEQDITKILLARVLAAQGKDDEALQLIAQLEARGYLEPEAEAVKAQIEMRAAAQESGGVQVARQSAEANPNDLALQIALAEALAADGRHRDAFEILLTVVDKDLAGANGKDAKAQMLKLFSILGNGNALVAEYRSKLSMLLF